MGSGTSGGRMYVGLPEFWVYQHVFSSETLFRKEALPITITVYMTSIVIYLNFRNVQTLKRTVHLRNEITVLFLQCLALQRSHSCLNPYFPQRVWFTFIF